MRTSPLIGRRAWFGPRRLGWGLAPVTIEGWTATMAYVVLSLVIRLWKVPRWLRVVLPGAFLVLVVLKGSAPGGRSKRADFDRIRAAQSA